MSKKIIILLFLCLVSVLAIACGNSNTTSSGYDSNAGNTSGYDSDYSTDASTENKSSGNEVHMAADKFVQTSITIPKGSKLTLVNDTAASHRIENGSWKDNSAEPLKEDGAPTVETEFNGSGTQVIGPFSVAGTYHLYCTFHPGMNLTVIVQ